MSRIAKLLESANKDTVTITIKCSEADRDRIGEFTTLAGMDRSAFMIGAALDVIDTMPAPAVEKAGPK